MGCFKECTAGFAKYILFLFNLLILVAAIILIVFGVKNKANNGGVEIMSVGTFAIAIAVVIALVAFFGCCGAVKESPCMLTTYAAILITLFIIQVVLGVIAFVAVKNGQGELQRKVEDHLSDLYKDRRNNNEHQKVIDDIQTTMKCCGVKGPSDSWVIDNGDELMKSCCKEGESSCTFNTAYKVGCAKQLEDFVSSNIKTIGVVAIVFSAIELVAALFACYVKKTRY
ncbi:unnamed protein product [Acanthoscelides obtectus]|uniref:Tetraspanin n=1 Tax=Acanthoscelides obtectus TaxID=200917 RepID=A0A9P0LEP1_ACAOB|nr:unnamed protein product [Acanthoscelides obtectus]CAK1675209.1 Leukocyte surface antigen CD53 [Acanthoscelides obtectus]